MSKDADQLWEVMILDDESGFIVADEEGNEVCQISTRVVPGDALHVSGGDIELALAEEIVACVNAFRNASDLILVKNIKPGIVQKLVGFVQILADYHAEEQVRNEVRGLLKSLCVKDSNQAIELAEREQ